MLLTPLLIFQSENLMHDIQLCFESSQEIFLPAYSWQLLTYSRQLHSAA